MINPLNILWCRWCKRSRGTYLDVLILSVISLCMICVCIEGVDSYCSLDKYWGESNGSLEVFRDSIFFHVLVASFRLIDILFPDVHFYKSPFWDLRVTVLTERIYYSVKYIKNFWFWIKENGIPTSMAACALSCDSNYNCYIASFSSICYYNFRYPHRVVFRI